MPIVSGMQTFEHILGCLSDKLSIIRDHLKTWIINRLNYEEQGQKPIPLQLLGLSGCLRGKPVETSGVWGNHYKPVGYGVTRTNQ